MNLFLRIKKALVGIPIILLPIGLVFFGVGAGLTYHQLIFRQEALQVPGEVISLSESCDDDGCAYSPVVRFATIEGETVFYHSNFASSPSEYEIGESVNIFYKTENPEKAIIAGEGGIFRYIFMGIGGVIFSLGIIIFAINLRNSFLVEA